MTRPPAHGTGAGGRRRLRVCMVHYSDSRLDSRILREARALAARGDEVDMIGLGEPWEERVGDGMLRSHRVRCGEKAGGGARTYLLGYGRFVAASAARVARLDAQRRFDVVEAHNMPDAVVFAGLVPRLRGTPLILNVHDTFPELFATTFGAPPDSRIVRAVALQERLSAALADAVVTVTDAARGVLEARGVGAGRTTVVMNAPDEGAFGPPRPAVAPPSTGAVRALYHGGLAPRFGVELLLRATGMLEGDAARVRLRVCGAGTRQAELAALAADLAPGRVDVAPAPVPFARIPAELEAADIGVVPTLPDPFTELLLPVKLLEYVHMGMPAVAPRLPVIADHFAADELFFFEPGSAEALAAAIAAVVADPQAAAARAARAAVRLRGFSWDEQRRRYLALVDGLAAAGRGAAHSTTTLPAPSLRRWPRRSTTRGARATTAS